MVCSGVVCDVYDGLDAMVLDVQGLNPFGGFDGDSSMRVCGD